ncbi:hypothetical protein [Methylobacterium sp. 37f]|uniref:hypothetical protein n=1 Tax=Methylobacterium sp. 37f TaxID=2817058 RepID=UPI001FFC9F48|nr:hypothetical protein [Methylobacterium sp. 37f]MCK2055261.1 hypothetical protein [Methylobacterium sp. 37f]
MRSLLLQAAFLGAITIPQAGAGEGRLPIKIAQGDEATRSAASSEQPACLKSPAIYEGDEKPNPQAMQGHLAEQNHLANERLAAGTGQPTEPWIPGRRNGYPIEPPTLITSSPQSDKHINGIKVHAIVLNYKQACLEYSVEGIENLIYDEKSGRTMSKPSRRLCDGAAVFNDCGAYEDAGPGTPKDIAYSRFKKCLAEEEDALKQLDRKWNKLTVADRRKCLRIAQDNFYTRVLYCTKQNEKNSGKLGGQKRSVVAKPSPRPPLGSLPPQRPMQSPMMAVPF